MHGGIKIGCNENIKHISLHNATFIKIFSLRLTLHKNQRLKSRKTIESLFKNGLVVNVFPYRVVYRLDDWEAEQPFLQAGFSVSARKFKKAVERNRIKRLTREAYRLDKARLEQALQKSKKKMALFFIYTGAELPVFALCCDKISIIVNKLIRTVGEKNTPDN